MEYRDLKTDPMQEAVRALLEKSKKAPVTDKDDDGEGMDPVGHGDKDIDNDGDHDSTDKYLTKRRKAITKAVKNESKGNVFQQLKGKVEEPLKGYPYNEEVEEVDEGVIDGLKAKLKQARDNIKNFHKTDAAQKVRDQQKKRIEKGRELASAPNLAKRLNRNQSNEEVQINKVLVQIDEIINSLGHRDANADAKRDQIRRERESEKKSNNSVENKYQALKRQVDAYQKSHDAYVKQYYAADERGDDEAADKAQYESDKLHDKIQDLKAEMAKLRKSQNESVNTPTKANGGIAHDCATHVAHEEYGLGTCVSEEHTLAEDGTVSHYDVIFERVGLKRAMPIEELKITKSEAHIHASKGKLFTPAQTKGKVKGKIGKSKPA